MDTEAIDSAANEATAKVFIMISSLLFHISPQLRLGRRIDLC